ncbi:GNAT family N-acetyltransferase [Nonomuraea sp. ATR24]|uniref:GNAT family N-acetyltransferase n=1 Tax=Nonomuraea sp. ATR24 TaxID=1676744 RepID=UPI0035C18B89
MTVPDLPADGGFLLRPWRLTDLPAVAEAAADPYIPLITSVPAVYSDAEGAAFVRRQWARAADGVGYSFAIARDGRAVGQIGLWPGPHGRGSVGYWVAGSARGQGVACAALRTCTPGSRAEVFRRWVCGPPHGPAGPASLALRS